MTVQLKVGLALAALLVALTSCGSDAQQSDASPRPVRWQYVSESTGTHELSFVGRTRARSEARVSPRIGGTVTEILVDVGDDVRIGDVIARIDPVPLQLQRDAAATQLAAARAQAAAADAAYDRVRSLHRQELASRQDYDAARAAAESSAAAVTGAERQLDLAQLSLSYATVSSPFDGRVSARLMNSGENIAAGHPLVLLVSRDHWEVTLSVPDAALGSVRRGADAEVVVASRPGQPLAGIVTGVGGGTSLGSGTFPVTVRLHEAPDWMQAGLISRVHLSGCERGAGCDAHPTLSVAASAVVQDREGQFVYRLEEHEAGSGATRLVRTAVNVGRLRQDEVEIEAGLEAGDRVVTLGLNHLADGMLVRPLERTGGNR